MRKLVLYYVCNQEENKKHKEEVKEMEYGKIRITKHARQRLQERMPEIDSSNYAQVVQAARYKGETEGSLKKTNPKFAKYISQRFYGNKSTEIRVYKNHVFVFFGSKGHSRVLKTVVDIPEKQLAKII